jgi:hypothetical protein
MMYDLDYDVNPQTEKEQDERIEGLEHSIVDPLKYIIAMRGWPSSLLE